MKKYFTLLLCLTTLSIFLNGQSNLISNPGFEDNTFTVSDAAYNPGNLLLMRIGSTVSTSTSTTQPSASSVTVNDGVWLKKQSVTSSILNAYHQPDGARSGTNCLMLRNGGGSGSQGITWSNFNFQQRLALENDKKYILTFWARSVFTVNSVTAFIGDITGNTGGATFAINVPLTGGTTWTKYTVHFDVPHIRSLNNMLDYSTAYVGIGYNVSYNATPTTITGQVLFDDISLTESTIPVIASSLESPTTSTLIPITITFNHDVTEFLSSSIVVTNGTVTNFAGSGATYSADIIPTTVGVVTVDIAAGAAVDGAENSTLAATQFALTYDNTTGYEKLTPKVSVYSESQSIIVHAQTGKVANIFTVNGQLQRSIVIDSEKVSVPISKGFYIVEVAGETAKVVVE
jgi:hypothetical protein